MGIVYHVFSIAKKFSINYFIILIIDSLSTAFRFAQRHDVLGISRRAVASLREKKLLHLNNFHGFIVPRQHKARFTRHG